MTSWRDQDHVWVEGDALQCDLISDVLTRPIILRRKVLPQRMAPAARKVGPYCFVERLGNTVMSICQFIVWIDETEARILRVDHGLQHDSTISARGKGASPQMLTCRAGGDDESNAFFFQVARALDEADEILIVGPSAIKGEFVRYMHKNDHSIDPRILGVETINHPSDSELAGFAKLYFTVGGARRRCGKGAGHEPST